MRHIDFLRPFSLAFCAAMLVAVLPVASAHDAAPPEGFTALFNGKDLTGWIGLEHHDPRQFAALSEAERKEKLAKNWEDLNAHWKVVNGELVNDGHGVFLTTPKSYGDIELIVDYLLNPKGDNGIYLRGTPQVQIWDPSNEKVWAIGADKGSGGLWNNNPGSPGKDPLFKMDRPIGTWNRFHIIQLGARTTVFLNGRLIVNHAIMDNFHDRTRALFPTGVVQLQTHGDGESRFKNIYLREIPSAEANTLLASYAADGFVDVFNGKTLDGWDGDIDNYTVVDGVIRCLPGKGGNLFTKAEYGNFVVRVEFKLPPAGNNGLAIRYPGKGSPAHDGMTEIQVLDTEHPNYKDIDPRQATGSVYGMIPATRGYLRPIGEWNYKEVTVIGSRVKVELNGSVILDGDVSKVTELMGNTPHPGKDLTRGHFGFAGHSDPVEFRNIRIKPLE